MTGPYNPPPQGPHWNQGPPPVTDEMIDAELARKKKNNRIALLLIAALVAVVIVVAIAIAFTSGSDDGEKSESSSTASTAEAWTYTPPPPDPEAIRRSQEARAAEIEAARARAAAQVDPSTYEQLSERDWLLIAKDPGKHIGRKVVLYGSVTQFDSGTGTNAFRANTGGEVQENSYQYDTNTIVQEGTPGLFDEVVTDDLVTLYVEIDGVMKYDTTIGGSTSAPKVSAYIVEVTGSE